MESLVGGQHVLLSALHWLDGPRCGLYALVTGVFVALQNDPVAWRCHDVGAAAAEALAHAMVREYQPVVDQESADTLTALLRSQPREEFVERDMADGQPAEAVDPGHFVQSDAVDGVGDIDRLGDSRAIGIPGIDQR